MRSLEKQGLKFKMGTKVTKGEVVGDKVLLTTEPSKGGAAEKMEAESVLVSIGELLCRDSASVCSIFCFWHAPQIQLDHTHACLYTMCKLVNSC